MDFTKTYDRSYFMNFLSGSFLPEDFEEDVKEVSYDGSLNFTSKVTKLGTCHSIKTTVYELHHYGKNDPRVSISREAFRILRQQSQRRALVLFVPQDDTSNYRFSLITMNFHDDEQGIIHTDISDPHRFSYYLGTKLVTKGQHTPQDFLVKKGRVSSFEDLQNRFSVEALSRQFYSQLFQWYRWAIDDDTAVSFPNIVGIPESAIRRTIKCEHIIRLITRLLFCWFIKQKHLIPDEIFTFQWAEKVLNAFNKTATDNGIYYNAILQNLFFATLNNEIQSRKWATNRSFQGRDQYYGIKCFYRDQDEKNGESFFSVGGKRIMEETFSKVPYLNGGLFECLDKEADADNDKVVYIDGFSRNNSKNKRAFIPNILFFNEDENKLGLLPLLRRYNFTIEENSQEDTEISLDPELLGRVFENLLADYNPETQESARKSTGSFYTPRIIVDYMVDESLITFLGSKGFNLDKLRKLIHSNTHISTNEWTDTDKESIINLLCNIRILDPACGSGAFPMGCLLKMVNIIHRLQGNTSNSYDLKLSIINNCIYGIDIQPIAMMISKLRFFISLICEQNDINLNDSEHNFGVNTLPNLETKFVAANSLISAEIRKYEGDWTNDTELTSLKEELLNIRKSQFLSTSRMKKIEKRREDKNKRKEIREYIINNATSPDEEKISIFQDQINALKNQLPQYKEEKWVEEWIQQAPTLFEIPQPTLFRHDINKEKRDAINSEISTIEAKIKKELRKGEIKGFESAVEQITLWNPYDQNSSSPFFNSEWMFGIKEGFDIVIGNPPYISTKGISVEDKQKYEKEFGFSDDTYYLFAVKGLEFSKSGGTLNYIIPKTFWTTQTKRGMRDLFLSKRINYVFDTADPFDAPMVDTCVIQVQNLSFESNHVVKVLDGSKDLNKPNIFNPILQQIWIDTQNCVIFKPTELNMRIFYKYGKIVKELYDRWWDKIKTSRDIEKNESELNAYRNSLKPGDVALLGCLTEGGQGLATANNGKYIAVRRSTKWADNIIDSRPQKLAIAIKKNRIKIPQMIGFSNEKAFLSSLSEKEIANLFDDLKEKYGRDIFGQGYIFKIINDSEMADVNSLTQDEKENGIEISKKYWVPYDKGDKDGNRWYLETPFAIAWNKENVQFLKTDPKARYQGYTFFFREGFCWNLVNGTRSYNDLKFKLSKSGINDVGEMKLYCYCKIVSNKFFVCVGNSDFASRYTESNINFTVNFQVNDCRQIPIVIPNNEQLQRFHNLYDRAYEIRKMQISDQILLSECNIKFEYIQQELNKLVYSLYGI